MGLLNYLSGYRSCVPVPVYRGYGFFVICGEFRLTVSGRSDLPIGFRTCYHSFCRLCIIPRSRGQNPVRPGSTDTSCDKKPKLQLYYCFRVGGLICFGELGRIKWLRFVLRSPGSCLLNNCCSLQLLYSINYAQNYRLQMAPQGPGSR